MYDDDTIAAMQPRMFSIAYRMLGSVSEAEDVVQEAFLRQQRALAEGVEIQSPAAYLSTVVTRLAIDELKSARAQRETYVGDWFPEPLLTDRSAADPAEQAEQADSLSWAFLLLLERLSPVERAVFLLHDVFDYGYGEIAEIVGKSPENCRQLATRARRHIEEGKPRFETSQQKRTQLAERFIAAVSEGDLDGIVAVLADDAVAYGDSGGKSPVAAHPIAGSQRIARFMAGLAARILELGGTIGLHDVNGEPGVIARDSTGRILGVSTFDIVDGRIQVIRSVANPDKLRHLGPVADALAFLRTEDESGR
jgi:RNA polymerase sigma-70 factor, ECF subfamily